MKDHNTFGYILNTERHGLYMVINILPWQADGERQHFGRTYKVNCKNA